jgi:hypothetical protein
MQRMIQMELPVWNQIKILPTYMKKNILPTEKLIICETVFCELTNMSVDIVIEMPIVETSIGYRVVEEHFK